MLWEAKMGIKEQELLKGLGIVFSLVLIKV